MLTRTGSALLGLLSLTLPACGVFEERFDPTYFYEYDASCPSLSEGARRTEVLRVAKALAEDFKGRLQVGTSGRDIVGAYVNLPLVAGAPPYRKDSSGQSVLSTQSDRLGATFTIVVYKVPKEEDELARSIKIRVETELATNCPKWKTETRRSIY